MTSSAPIVDMNGPASGGYSTINVTKGGAAVLIGIDATVADPDSPDFDGGILSIYPNTSGSGDVMSIQSQGTAPGQISVAGNLVYYGGVHFATITQPSTGTGPTVPSTHSLYLTLNANANPAAVQALLRQVTYQVGAQSFGTEDRFISIQLRDGDGGDSSFSGFHTGTIVKLGTVNAAPTVVASSTQTWFTESPNNGPPEPVRIDPHLQVNDSDSNNLASATIQITGGFMAGEDVLDLPGAAFFGMSASYDASSGTLRLTASGANPTLTQWQQALTSVRYVNVADEPSGTSRTFTITVNDGAASSAPATKTISIVATTDPTVIDLNGPAEGVNAFFAYTEQAPAAPFAPGAMVTDADTANFGGGRLTVQHSGPGAGLGHSADVIGILHSGSNAGQIGVSGATVTFGGVAIGTFSGGSGAANPLVVDLTGAATPAAVQALVRSLTYFNGSDNPPPSAMLNITLRDGAGGTSATVQAAISVTQVDDPTTLDLNGPAAGNDGVADYEIGKLLTVVAPAGRVIDEDAENFAYGSLTLRLIGGQAGDTIGIIDQGMGSEQISVVDGNVVTWGGMKIGTVYPLQGRVVFDVQSVPTAAVEALVRAIGFTNSQAAPPTGQRVIEFQLLKHPNAQPLVQSVTVNFVSPATLRELTGDDGPNELIGAGGDDRLFGLGGNDTLTGNGGNDFLDGGTGNDIINGNDGDDRIAGGDGDDQIWGGTGNDVIDGGLGADFLRGDAGDDLFQFSGVRSSTAETPIGLIDGGLHHDTIDFSAVSPVVLGTLQISPGVFSLGAYVGSQRFQIVNVERILFGPGNDSISLPPNHTAQIQIFAGGGNDRLTGGGSAHLFGEDGDDEFFISGSFGAPATFGLVNGGAGTDLVKLNIAFTVDLETGFASAGSSTFFLESIEHVQVAATAGYKSKVSGSAAGERIGVNPLFNDGSVGVEFNGRGGNDVLSGSVAADLLNGGAGDDEIAGGSGNDLIDGGEGVDTAVFGYASTAASVLIVGGSLQVVGPEGTDLLTGVELVRFTDRTIDAATLATDSLVDDAWYLARNPDVAAAGLDADFHFAEFGWREGRDPNALFDTRGYLAANPEVRAAGINPLVHYTQSGARDGRDPSLQFDADLYLARNPDVRAAGLEPLQHFLLFGQAEGRKAFAAVGPLNEAGFDRQYYLMTNPDVAAAGIDPYQHFLQFGWREGRDPNRLFDVDFYLGSNPDVRAAGLNPLLHFNQFGWREGRDPAHEFDTQFYLARNQDAAGVNPMIHFLTVGSAEGRLAFGAVGTINAAGFDSAFYLRANPDVAAARVDPYQHFLQWGWQEGRDPNALFDTSAYLAANPDVRAAGLNPLLHYHSDGWREGRDPGPAFDTASYLAIHRDVAAAGLNPMAHFLQTGAPEGRAFSFAIGPLNELLFDAQYYLQVNRDVAAAGVDPFQHFLAFGWREGRDPNAWFDTSYYLITNPDVAAAGINPLIHYMHHGWQEGRDPSVSFDTRFYLQQNSDVAAAGMNPFFHFLNFGAAEGRATVPGQPSAPRPASAASNADGYAAVLAPLEDANNTAYVPGYWVLI